MDGSLLEKWLSLPAGSWPPPHYALLGLEPGTGDADEAESRALGRMEALRHYQIRHPDEVTEGMNRLARAMVVLTDPAQRREYDESLGLEPPPGAEPGPPPAEEAIPVAAEQWQPGEEGGPAGGPPPAEFEVPDPRAEVLDGAARLWRAVWAWEAFGEYLRDPRRRLADGDDGLRLQRAARELVGAAGGAAAAGSASVLALARQPMLAQTFRGLLDSQRESLAEDWRAGRADLRGRLRSLRRELRSLRPPKRRRPLTAAKRWVGRRPELILLAGAAWALAAAWLRSLP